MDTASRNGGTWRETDTSPPLTDRCLVSVNFAGVLRLQGTVLLAGTQWKTSFIEVFGYRKVPIANSNWPAGLITTLVFPVCNVSSD